jgi:hypothetical protein
VSTAHVVGRLLAISLPLYFAGEMLQMPAFTGTPPGWLVHTLMCALATLLDAALVLGLYGVGVWVFRDWLWFRPPRFRRYLPVVLLAIVVNSVWEWITVGWMGLWGYSAWHPTVAGVGLAAILQAVVMPPAVFLLLARWEVCGGGSLNP